MRATISWRIPPLAAPLPRRFLLRPPRPVFIYTAASGYGNAGRPLHYGGRLLRTTSRFPPWLAVAREEIAEYELAAEILGVFVAREIFPGAPILLMCDNQCSLATAVLGSRRTSQGRALAAVFGTSSLIWGYLRGWSI